MKSSDQSFPRVGRRCAAGGRLGPLVGCLAACLLAGCDAGNSQGPEPPSSSGGQRQSAESRRFDATFARWKDTLGQLFELDLRYRAGPRSDQATIKEEFDRLLADAEKLEQELIESAITAYVKAPPENRDLVQFILFVVQSHMGLERYEDALRLTQLLIDNQVRLPMLSQIAGVAAFHVGDFDLADRHLRAWKQYRATPESSVGKPRGEKRREGTSDVADQYLALLPYYRDAWAKEQAIRSAEQAANDLPRCVLRTNKGEIELELFENEAPNTVANFISLVESGFYNGLTFYKVRRGEAAEAGCPNGDGTGGPGYAIRCECYAPNHRLHFRGSVAMAIDAPNTGGSRFCIMFKPMREMDGRRTVFGRVVRGLDVLAKLQPRIPRSPMEVAINPHANVYIPRADTIVEAKVLRKRPHAYVPEVLRKISFPQSPTSAGDSNG
jgi:cyclophilin family peptidyl-prolyl cis-trans isomerase